MVKINYLDLSFDHIVVFNSEETIFACSREEATGKTRLFLVFGKAGHVYTRNGRTDSWELLEAPDAERIRGSIKDATASGITVYQFTGSSEAITGQAIPFAS